MLRCAKSIRHLKFSKQWSNYLLHSSYRDDALPKKTKLAPLQERKMVDKVKLYAKGGDGGNGCHSIHRSKRDGRGKPDGGNGGRGGDVILECSPTVWDFSSLQHHAIAGKGGHGTSKNMIGTRGSDKIVRVPIGTVIHLVKGEICNVAVETPASKDLDPWELPGKLTDTSTEFKDPSQEQNPSDSTSLETEKPTEVSNVNQDIPSVETPPRISTSESCSEEENSSSEEEMRCDVAELIKQGERIIVCRGGEGGLGSVSLSKKPKNPEDDGIQTSLRAGSPGSELTLVLELKSIADVSFVGIPNAGKSTLLGAISRAKPSVGDYAFTTLRPNLGNLNFDDLSITVADIPGLIKGAHEDRGLGHAFLRHIERTKVIAYVVDLAAALEGRKGISPWEQLRDLVSELEHHQEGLSDRPSLIVANKIDEEGAVMVFEELKTRVEGVPIYPVCAILEEGVPELKAGLRMLVDGGISESLKIDRILVD